MNVLAGFRRWELLTLRTLVTTAVRNSTSILSKRGVKHTELDDSDTFGTIADPDIQRRYPSEWDVRSKWLIDEAMEAEAEANTERAPLSSQGYLYGIEYYKEKIIQMVNDKKVAEALEFYKTRMLEQDRVKPDIFCYRSLIKGLASEGNITDAFRVFKQMREVGFLNYNDVPYSQIFTSLFKACALSKNRHESLQQITFLRKFIKDKGIQMHPRTRNAMILAYGRQGALVLALNAADEAMAERCLPFDQLPAMFNSLLSACCTDRANGLECGLQIIKLMTEMGVKFDVNNFNLVLRIIRDCDLPASVTHNVNRVALVEGSSVALLPCRRDLQKTTPERLNFVTTAMQRPDPHSKLAIFGGIAQLRHLLSRNTATLVTPDIRSFHLIMQLIPVIDEQSEEEVLNWMKGVDVKPDVDFYNFLLYRAVMRKDQPNVEAEVTGTHN